MRTLKIILSVVGLVAVVGVVAIGSIMMFADPNKLKPVLAKAVMTQTGYQLVIDGNLSWSLYPKFGIKMKHMTLSMPNNTEAFVDLKDVSVAMSFWQILHGGNNLQGDVHIGDARLTKINAQNIHVGLHWEDNVLTLQPITAALYNGSLEGTAHGRNLTATPRWEWVVQMNQVQMKPLLQDMNGPNNKLNVTGLAQIKFNASIQGDNREQMMNSLYGTTDFTIKNGTVEGVDVNYLIQSAVALVSKQTLTLPTTPNVTAFDSLTGAMLIKDGVATANNLTLSAPSFITKGVTKINFVNDEIGSQLQISPQQETKFKWEIPVQISGNIKSPEVRLDTVEIERLVSRQDFEDIKAKVREKIKSDMPGKTGQYLQSLLG